MCFLIWSTFKGSETLVLSSLTWAGLTGYGFKTYLYRGEEGHSPMRDVTVLSLHACLGILFKAKLGVHLCRITCQSGLLPTWW